MSVMILVVLAVVWVVALTPWIIRKLSERQVVSSVTSYHRQLLRLGSSWDRSERGSISVPGAPIGFSAAAQRVHEGLGLGDPGFDAGVRPGYADGEAAAPSAPVVSPATTIRRRRVVAVLLATMLFFFLVGLIPGAHILWDVALVCLAFGAAYLAALIHFHRLAVERAQKVVALQTRRSVVSALDRARASGSAPGRLGHVAPASQLHGSGWSVTGEPSGELVASGR